MEGEGWRVRDGGMEGEGWWAGGLGVRYRGIE